MSKSVIVTISKQGEVSVDLHGFKGVGCAELTQAFTNALGTVSSETVKPELYEEDSCATITQYQ